MAEELTVDILEEDKKLKESTRVSNPGRQAIASVLDLGSDIVGLPGLVGAAGQAGYNYLTEDNDKSFPDQFANAASSGADAWFLKQSDALRKGTNSLLDIAEPISAEDIAARNSAMFIPIPGVRLAKGAGKLARAGRFAMDTILPTVKRGTKTNMAVRGGIQGGLALGFDQGVRALMDDPKMPLMLSDQALEGLPITPNDPRSVTEQMSNPLEGGAGDDELTVDMSDDAELTVETLAADTELTVDVPSESIAVATQDQLDMDARMQKASDWDDVQDFAVTIAAILGGAYTTKRLLQIRPVTAPPVSAGNSTDYAHATVMDRGKHADHSFQEMGVDDITREAIDDTIHTDVNGIAREAVSEGKYGQGFDNNKWVSHSATVLDNDEAVLRQAGKDKLFNDAMKAQSEMSSVADGRQRSLWRQGTSDTQLTKTISDARADADVSALMDKHAQNYRADLEYEVHRGLTTREEADKLLRTFGDIHAGQKGTYMPFYGDDAVSQLSRLSRKFLGINTKAGDDLRTQAEYLARDGSTSKNIVNASEAAKRHRLHNTAYVNDQLYKNEILSKLAGIMPHVDGFTRQVVRNGRFVPSHTAMTHAETGRGTHLVAVADDIGGDNPNSMLMKLVTDDDQMKLGSKYEGRTPSINDIRNELGNKLVTVHHKGKMYAYSVPDAGVRAALELNPRLGKVLEFNNHWRNVFTKFTTGDFSLFAPMSHAFSAQQVAWTTAAREGVGQGFKSLGRSLGGSRDMFMDQMAGVLADHMSRSIATSTGLTQKMTGIQKTLHNRYSNSLLSKIRSETGRTNTGIGTTQQTLQQTMDTYGATYSKIYGPRQMGLVKNMLKAFNNAANEGPAYGVIQREIGKAVQSGQQPNIKQIRRAVEQGKTLAGDMSRRGSSKIVQGINASIPFSSAALQSWNALGAAAKHDWKAFGIGAAALIGAPTITELGLNAATSKMPGPDGNPMTFKDASGISWTYDDYYWNGFTTQQRVDNMILFVPGQPPWEAIVYPISPEWGLMRAITLESADALFNLSQVGSIGTADEGRGQVGRDHFIHAIHRLFDIPLPPWMAAAISSTGTDIRAGLNIADGGDPSNPSKGLSFLENIPIGTGERVTGRMGRTKDVNGFHDKITAAMIKDIFGAGGSAYVAFAEAINAGITNQGGSIGRGLQQGLESILDSGRRQARYTNPFGKVFKPNSNDEIASTLHGKRQSLMSLSNDADVLEGKEGWIFVAGEQVPVDTIIPTQDPIRIDLAKDADIAMNNIAMLDKTIALLRKEITKAGIATNLGSQRERQDIIDGKQLEIQHFKAQQLGTLHTFEDQWSERFTDMYDRDITVNLSGGMGKTIAARPNLDSTSPVPR